MGPGFPPAPKGLLQVHGGRQRQAVLQLPRHQLQAQGQPLSAQAQGTLGDGQPQDVDDTWKKNESGPGRNFRGTARPQQTRVGEVKGSEERVVVFGCHSGMGGVQENPISPQQLLHLLLQLLLLLDDEGRRPSPVGLLRHRQTCEGQTRSQASARTLSEETTSHRSPPWCGPIFPSSTSAAPTEATRDAPAPPAARQRAGEAAGDTQVT